MVDNNYVLYFDIVFLYIFGLLFCLDFIEFFFYILFNLYSMVDMKLRYMLFLFFIRDKLNYLIVVVY